MLAPPSVVLPRTPVMLLQWRRLACVGGTCGSSFFPQVSHCIAFGRAKRFGETFLPSYSQSL